MSKIYGLIDRASNIQRRLYKAVTIKKENYERPIAVNYPIAPKIEAKVKDCIKANQDLQEAIETCEEKCNTLANYNRYYPKLVQIKDEFKKANKEIPVMNVEALKLLNHW
jgi:FtsZ-binding cell division protein ZapB